MKIVCKADISVFESLAWSRPAKERGDGESVSIQNVDIALRDVVKYSNNTELNALYEQLLRYGTEDKADTMLRGYRPADMGELIGLLRQGLSAPQHDKKDEQFMDSAMLQRQKALVDRWERDGADLQSELEGVRKSQAQYDQARRFGLLGWLPGRARKRREAYDKYLYASRLAQILQDRISSQKITK